MPRRKSSNHYPRKQALNGAICAQFKRCGKPGCKCSRGELHGPYFYRFIWHRGRMVKVYIRLANVEEARAACARHRQAQEKRRASMRDFTKAMATMRQMLKECGL